MPNIISAIVASLVAAALSQVTSDVAAAELLLPIAYRLAAAVGAEPLFMMIPVAAACSTPFMLPISTPPNAIAFGSGLLEVRDYVCHGWILVFCGVFLGIVFYLLLGSHLLIS